MRRGSSQVDGCWHTALGEGKEGAHSREGACHSQDRHERLRAETTWVAEGQALVLSSEAGLGWPEEDIAVGRSEVRRAIAKRGVMQLLG